MIGFRHIIIALWFVLTVVHAVIVAEFGISGFAAITDSLVSNLIIGFISTGAGYSIRYYRPDNRHLLFIIVGVASIALLYSWGITTLLNEIIFADSLYSGFLQQSFAIRTMVAFFILALSVTTGWLLHFNNEYLDENSRLNEIKRLAKDAELNYLVQKIQPHFLFNTLNSVNALIRSDVHAAGLMVQQLADFLRGSLRNDQDEQVTLENEISQLKLYLAIEQVRFGSRLNTDFKLQEESLKKKIPALMLQPLVENAIKFGLYDTLGLVTILIESKYENNVLLVRVTNPYDEESGTDKKGTGFGLSALERRLYLLYGRNDLLELKREDGCFCATIKIPGK